MTDFIYKLIRSLKRLYNGPVDPLELMCLKWLEDDGENKYRLNYPLNKESLVWDIGGYNGDFAAAIYCKYSCNIRIYEPITDYSNVCKGKFLFNDKVTVFNYGLSSSDSEVKFSVAEESSSKYKESNYCETVFLKDVTKENDLARSGFIDLAKINIEGGEYDLLDSLLRAKLITRFKNLQIQFHNFVPGHSDRYDAICMQLSKTHNRTYCYPFIWENWELKVN